VCSFIESCFENNVPFDNTNPFYLINLHWKLGFLGFKLRLRVKGKVKVNPSTCIAPCMVTNHSKALNGCTILAFFTENEESEHLPGISWTVTY